MRDGLSPPFFLWRGRGLIAATTYINMAKDLW